MNPLLSALANIGWKEIMIALVVVLIVFGGRRLPELGRSLGKGLREFKHGLSNADDDSDDKKPPPPPPVKPPDSQG